MSAVEWESLVECRARFQTILHSFSEDDPIPLCSCGAVAALIRSLLLQQSSSHSAELILSLCSTHPLTLQNSFSHSTALILPLYSTHPLTLQHSFSHSTALILSLCILPKTLLLQDDPIDLTVQGFFLGRRPYFLYVRMVLLQCCCSAV